MNNLLEKNSPLKFILLIAVIVVTAYYSNAQSLKPSKSGYASANGINMYYEVYGEGKLIIYYMVLLHH